MSENLSIGRSGTPDCLLSARCVAVLCGFVAPAGKSCSPVGGVGVGLDGRHARNGLQRKSILCHSQCAQQVWELPADGFCEARAQRKDALSKRIPRAVLKAGRIVTRLPRSF